MSQHSAPIGHRAGVLISSDIDRDHVVHADLMACVHCGYVWKVQPGSGKLRGYCTRCAGFVCGHRHCREMGCVPQEQQLENMEAGRPLDYRPITVSRAA